jgi:hypothetical protein
MPHVAVQTTTTSDLVIPDPESNQVVRVLGYALSSDGAGTFQFMSGDTELSGPMDVADSGGFVCGVSPNGIGWFDTNRGEGLTIATTGGIHMNGHVVFAHYPS